MAHEYKLPSRIKSPRKALLDLVNPSWRGHTPLREALSTEARLASDPTVQLRRRNAAKAVRREMLMASIPALVLVLILAYFLAPLLASLVETHLVVASTAIVLPPILLVLRFVWPSVAGRV